MTLESIVTIRGISVVFETVARPIVLTAVKYCGRLLTAVSDTSDGVDSLGPPDGGGRAVEDVCTALGVH